MSLSPGQSGLQENPAVDWPVGCPGRAGQVDCLTGNKVIKPVTARLAGSKPKRSLTRLTGFGQAVI